MIGRTLRAPGRRLEPPAGGLGRVYLAASPAGRAVAITVIHPELAHDSFRSRFRPGRARPRPEPAEATGPRGLGRAFC